MHEAQSKPADSIGTKRAWARYIKWALASVVLVGLAVYVILVAADYRVFRQQTIQFGKVRLTDTRAEVLYKLGRPQAVEEGLSAKDPYGGFSTRIYFVDGPSGDQNTMPSEKKLEDFPGWHWSREWGSQVYTAVSFDKAGVVKSIICYDQLANLAAWGPLAGIRDGASEDRILILGKPTSSTIKGITKTIEFDDIGVRFHLVKDKAYSAELRQPTGGEFAILRRFLHTLLP